MTQEDLKDYFLLPEHGCYLYKTKVKEDGLYYFIRNKETRKLVVVYPVKKGTYAPASVCHSCNQLSVPIPEWATCMRKVVDKATREAEEIRKPL